MPKIPDAAATFLGHSRIAVTGVPRAPENHGANVVYKRLRDRGYDVYAINPNATEVEGDRCYDDLGSVPLGVDAVVRHASHRQRPTQGLTTPSSMLAGGHTRGADLRAHR